MANSYDIPSWAGKPPTGLHLDVLKEDKLVQKLMVDEKKCYLFGRNNQMNDFCIDHASCSRVHAAFVYHKHLHKAFLVDLGSTHGTFIGTLRLEPHKPTQLQINSTFHFGASTRNYILRERPSVGTMNIIEDLPTTETMLGLPESQTELDNLTEYNTAHNRRISMLGIAEDSSRKNPLKQSNRKKRCVTFNDEEIIINPEDVDPNVGRFRNLIQTTVLPPKRARFEVQSSAVSTSVPSISHQMFQHRLNEMKQPTISNMNSSLYQGLPSAHDSPNMVLKHSSTDFDVTPIAMGTKLGLLLPNPAPEVTLINEPTPVATPTKPVTNTHRFDNHSIVMDATSNGPQKKKYAKEAWPGRKPMLGQL
ncbi:nuclear inhibitor of protein phosphatase 1 [Teleopsis dalmanni]|uniref:nuclear inhibitor of protein phosphatase 1 n=1 Tax=Teleopsis dalmanni TaxID=139649 RepID=UPI0018CF0DA7|nr:nuclear inhibitor of protein phosphatase 1 [Teleopsis dalmanni]